MAGRIGSFAMSNITASADFTRVQDHDLERFLEIFADDVKRVVNGNLDFQTNFRAKLISVVFTSANTNTTVFHGLGQAPTGYIVSKLSAPMTVYDGTLESNKTTITLRSSAAGTALLLIF